MQVTRYNQDVRGMQQVMRKYTFQAFINDELKNRGWSQRDLAKQMDVSSSTISRMLDEQKPSKPDVEQLVKLSKALHVGLETLTALAYPEQFEESALSPSARILGERFDKLPENVQQAVLAIMRQWGEE